MINVTTLLPGPGVVGPVVLWLVTNSDLRSVQPLSAAVSPVGDLERRDDIRPPQVDLPPWVRLLQGVVATVPVAVKGVAPPINGLGGVREMAR